MIEIRKYSHEYENETLKQIANFFGFHSSLYNEETDTAEKNFEEKRETLKEWQINNNELYIIFFENINVGFLRIGYRGGNVAWIEDIYIDSAFRRKGIATEVIQLAEKIIYSNPNYTAVCFDVVPRNTAALRLYYKLGYNNLSIVTVRKELYENKNDKKADLLGFQFNY